MNLKTDSDQSDSEVWGSLGLREGCVKMYHLHSFSMGYWSVMCKKWVDEKLGWQLDVQVRDACSGMNYNSTLWDHYFVFLAYKRKDSVWHKLTLLERVIGSIFGQSLLTSKLLMAFCKRWYNSTNKRQVAEVTFPCFSLFDFSSVQFLQFAKAVAETFSSLK